MVKLSQPHVHKATGPMFKLGGSIITACQLQPVVCASVSRGSKQRVTMSRGVGPSEKQARQIANALADVEPDSSSESDSSVCHKDDEAAKEYRRKKRMSSAIFRYFMHADITQQADLQVDISKALQLQWKDLEARKLVKKIDDLGDALLDALNEILCGSSNYRPLIPSHPSLHVNRSVVVRCWFSAWFLKPWNLVL